MIETLNYNYHLQLHKPKRISGAIGNLEENSNDITKNYTHLTLSKAYKSKVIDYLSTFTKSINTTKNIAIDMQTSYDKFDTNARFKGSENIKKSLTKKNNDFVNDINRLNDFAISDEGSEHSKIYADSINNLMADNIKALNSIGISYDGKTYNYDEEFFANTKISDISKNKDDLANLFDSINSETNEFLKIPIEDNTNFKDFSFYFNYSLGLFQKNTFNVIGLGVLVNLKL